MSYAIAHVPAAQVVYSRFTHVLLTFRFPPTLAKSSAPKWIPQVCGPVILPVPVGLHSMRAIWGWRAYWGIVGILAPPQTFYFECSRAFDLKSNRAATCVVDTYITQAELILDHVRDSQARRLTLCRYPSRIGCECRWSIFTHTHVPTSNGTERRRENGLALMRKGWGPRVAARWPR